MSVILPPPDIRTVVEKLAAYVVKNGAIFEEKILEKERHNPRFSFLFPSDPYHAYYQKRLEEYHKVGPEYVDEMLAQSRALEQAKEYQQQQEQQQQSARPSKRLARAPPKEPEPLEFLLELPAVSALDYDVMKLTALYAARNGRQFTFNLSQRELRNSQFDFLKPSHSLHSVFLRLVEHYSRVMLPSRALLDGLALCAHEKYRVLERIYQRVEYTRFVRDQQIKADELAEREKREYAAVDWHDFAVVETIEFGPADRATELPKPLGLAALAAMSLMQRRELWNGNTTPGLGLVPAPLIAQADQGGEAEMEMEVEETTTTASAAASIPQAKRPTVTAAVAPTTTAASPVVSTTGGHQKVRHDYVPKAQAQADAGREATEICSYCRLAFPKSQIAEHMRVEALDPKWREQRESHEAKYRDTNYATSGQEIFANLGSLTKTRAQLAGLAAEEAERLVSEASRAAAASTVQYDGSADPESAGRATREAMRKAKSHINPSETDSNNR